MQNHEKKFFFPNTNSILQKPLPVEGTEVKGEALKTSSLKTLKNCGRDVTKLLLNILYAEANTNLNDNKSAWFIS